MDTLTTDSKQHLPKNWTIAGAVAQMELVKIRGVRTKPVNLPDSMVQMVRQFGPGRCFADTYPDAA